MWPQEEICWCVKNCSFLNAELSGAARPAEAGFLAGATLERIVMPNSTYLGFSS